MKIQLEWTSIHNLTLTLLNRLYDTNVIDKLWVRIGLWKILIHMDYNYNVYIQGNPINKGFDDYQLHAST